MNRDTVYVDQILDAISKIEKYTEGGKKAFHNEVMVQDAVIGQKIKAKGVVVTYDEVTAKLEEK